VLLIVVFEGIFASLAGLMFNCVRKEDIDYSPYDEGEWRYLLYCSFDLLIVDFLVDYGDVVSLENR